MNFHFLRSVFFRSFVVLSSLVVFFIASYLYGSAGWGVISYLVSFYTSFAMILSFGFGRVIYKAIAEDAKSETLSFRVLGYYSYFSAALLLFVLILLSLFVPSQYLFPADIHFQRLFFGFGIYFYYLWQCYAVFLYSVKQSTNSHDWIIFLSRLSQIVVALIAACFRVSLDRFIILYSFTCFAIFWWEYRLILKASAAQSQLLSLREFVESIRQYLLKCFWPYFDTLAQMITSPLTLLVLGLSVTSVQLGQYAFALQLFYTLCFPFSVYQVKLQEKILLVNDFESFQKVVKKWIFWILPLSLGVIVCGLFVPLFITIIGFKSYILSGELLKNLLPILPVCALHYALGGIWIGTHKAKISSISNFILGLVNILIILIFSHSMELYSTVLGIYIAYSVAVALQLLILLILFKKKDLKMFS